MKLANQRGTTLVVGLLLLIVVTLLGLAGADSANIERHPVRWGCWDAWRAAG